MTHACDSWHERECGFIHFFPFCVSKFCCCSFFLSLSVSLFIPVCDYGCFLWRSWFGAFLHLPAICNQHTWPLSSQSEAFKIPGLWSSPVWLVESHLLSEVRTPACYLLASPASLTVGGVFLPARTLKQKHNSNHQRSPWTLTPNPDPLLQPLSELPPINSLKRTAILSSAFGFSPQNLTETPFEKNKPCNNN